MTRTTNDQRIRPASGLAWTIDPSSATFELRVDHPLGPARIAAVFRRVEGMLRHDAEGRIAIGFAVDTASLEPGRTDPRLRSHRFVADRDASPVVLFESTRVSDEGHGRLSVSGELFVGAERLPVRLRVDVTRSGRVRELTAITAADHRRLGATWLPLGPLRAPTELVLRARLTPVSDELRGRSIAMRPGSGSRVARQPADEVV